MTTHPTRDQQRPASAPVPGQCEAQAASWSTCLPRSDSAVTRELSSLSIEDQEDTQFPFAMRDPPPVSHPGDQLHAPVHREAEETNGRLPHLSWTLPSPSPCPPTDSPTAPPRPSRGGRQVDFHPSPLRRQLASQVSLDSPLSPASRPRSPWGRSNPYDSPEDQDNEYVGFAAFLNQANRKMVKKGLTFTLLVVGESGLGKSTLINSLFLSNFYTNRKVKSAEERIKQTVAIEKHSTCLEEKGIRLQLTIVDSPGLGDAINNSDCWKPVVDYVDQQFEQYFRDESSLNRRNIQDNRVHCCLYFISNSGHGLRPIDVECMKALQDKVNIIPVLAKADTMTEKERFIKKQKIREEISEFGINIYQFPECDSDEDDDYKKQDHMLKQRFPFAVIGSTVQMESEGRRFRGRAYPWGMVDVEDPSYSDFPLLRNMLMRTHTQDLIDVTQETHYEHYRAQCIQSMTRMVAHERGRSEGDFPQPLANINNRQICSKDDLQQKMQRF